MIKAINLANSPLFEADLRSAVDEVGGVLIDEHLSQDQLGDLFHAADVYVSLHRSEGFGLGLAEAMAIGKAVVGTAYSVGCTVDGKHPRDITAAIEVRDIWERRAVVCGAT